MKPRTLRATPFTLTRSPGAGRRAPPRLPPPVVELEQGSEEKSPFDKLSRIRYT